MNGPGQMQRQINLGDDFVRREDVRSRVDLFRACLHRRPGEAWAIARSPGSALHGALCRSAGIDPNSHGSITAMARALGLKTTWYHRLVDGAVLQTVADAATERGLYLVALPGGRYVCGDRPMELGTEDAATEAA